MLKKTKHNILFLSTFPPRECGIATFTKDLVNAINKKFKPVIKSRVIAINNEVTDIYNYDKSVIGRISATNIEDYANAANKINEDDDIRLIHVQHEFGIFGGENGNHLVPFFQVIKKPVFITFHSVLPKPKRNLKRTVRFLMQGSKAVIVMNELSKKILEKEYEAENSKVVVIPHGIPRVQFNNGAKEKQSLGLNGKIILSTFGLLSKGKGIEYAIRALPKVVKRFPKILYLVIGETHPVIRKREGEHYRNFLKNEVERSRLKDYVKFYNKYLTLDEIVSYLKATDIYISPSIDLRQSVSGTLSYALGCGRPVISTASSYARSIVTRQRGILVKPKNSKAIARALLALLKDPETRAKMSHTSYAETRHMTWPNVALAHFNLYRKYTSFAKKETIPAITLKHLGKLTDKLGVIQFAKHTKPDIRHGYCVDDNARAIIVAAKYWGYSKNKYALNLLGTYLNFVEFVQKPNGLFANFVNSKKFIDDVEFSEDAQGRTIWALGFLLSQRTIPTSTKSQAEKILRKAIPKIKNLKSPRAIAFAILGLFFYNQAYPKSRYKNVFKRLADYQVKCFQKTASKDWPWFENYLTYSNSKLPESLFYSYMATGKKIYLEIAEKSLRFLIKTTFDGERFSPIGQGGWYFRYGRRSYFDQQPEETSSMVQTLLVAYQATKKELYKKYTIQAFKWFLGKNHLNQVIYDETTGGCHDGLGRYTINMNQGAESTISYLLARLAIKELYDIKS